MVSVARLFAFRGGGAVHFFHGVGLDGLADRHFRVCNLAGNDISVALRSGKKRVFRDGDVVAAAVERVHVGGAS